MIYVQQKYNIPNASSHLTEKQVLETMLTLTVPQMLAHSHTHTHTKWRPRASSSCKLVTLHLSYFIVSAEILVRRTSSAAVVPDKQ